MRMSDYLQHFLVVEQRVEQGESSLDRYLAALRDQSSSLQHFVDHSFHQQQASL